MYYELTPVTMFHAACFLPMMKTIELVLKPIIIILISQ